MVYLKRGAIALTLLFLCLLIYSFHISNSINVLFISSDEQTWSAASAICQEESPKSNLPSSLELISLYYYRGEVLENKSTDYWAREVLFNRAFGLNTKLGILSFDEVWDEDHFICVEYNKF